MKLTMFGSSAHSDKQLILSLLEVKHSLENMALILYTMKKQEAIEHSKKYYGEAFFKRHGQKLFEDTIYYFKDKVEYEKLIQEHRDLTFLITLKNTQECNNKNKRI